MIVLLLALPAFGALLLGCAPVPARTARIAGTTVAGATLAVAAIVAGRFDYGAGSRAQDVVNARWLPAVDVRFHVGIDGISLPLVL
ncbi:MAG: hypothetical protein JO079_01095, partial [Frankiaceae bacterium]|nr:hypothetical protein [Frankiaceae bacterium]